MRAEKMYFTGHGAEDEFFSAVMSLDKARVEQLKASGIKLSRKAKFVLVHGEFIMDTYATAKIFWEAYSDRIKNVSKEDFAWLTRTFFEETKSKLYFSREVKRVVQKFFYEKEVLTVLLECYKLRNINQKRTMMEIIDRGNVPQLELCAAQGWLKQAKKRDDMIGYAQARNRPEVTAWLLDYKNRTADLAAERVKAEKKAERELNAAPDSALEMGKLWRWKKREDGTLIITGYKGDQTEVTIPVKIGKNTVTAIDKCALAHDAPMIKEVSRRRLFKIEKITVPNGIKMIGENAFGGLGRYGPYLNTSLLKEIILPETLVYFMNEQAAFNAPIISDVAPIAVVPRLKNARIFCIRNNLRYRFVGEDTVHIPYKEVIESDPLFSAILEGDEEKVRELKKNGAVLTPVIRQCLLNEMKRGSVYHDIRAAVIYPLFRKTDVPNREFILRSLMEELGEPLAFQFGITNDLTPKMLDLRLTYTCTKHINRIGEMQIFIINNKLEHLAVCAKHDWLKLPETREKMIRYASIKNKIEALLWLLDYKKRTANLDAERERAEKKAERELNADPNSALALKQIWSWKKQDDGTLIITKYKGTRTDIAVPSTIGGGTVTAIGEDVFSPSGSRLTDEQRAFRKTISRVTLPDSIRSIGKSAFRACEGLTAFDIPDSVVEIDDFAFSYCHGLTELVIPDTVERLGVGLFYGCRSLNSVKLPEKLDVINEHMFGRCKALRSITLHEGIRLIDSGAFSQCESLSELALPNSLVGIETQAFSHCCGLTELVIPDTVTEIGNGAFEWCTALTSVKLPESITEIGSYMFTCCEALRKLELPAAVQRIKMGAFSGCGSLEEIVIPEGAAEIEWDAFINCGALKTVVIPASVNEIAVNALDKTVFQGSDNVTVIVEPNSFAEEYCQKYNIDFKVKV